VRAGAVRSTRAASLARPRHWRNGGHDTCNAREGQHDDLVLAVARRVAGRGRDDDGAVFL